MDIRGIVRVATGSFWPRAKDRRDSNEAVHTCILVSRTDFTGRQTVDIIVWLRCLQINFLLRPVRRPEIDDVTRSNHNKMVLPEQFLSLLWVVWEEAGGWGGAVRWLLLSSSVYRMQFRRLAMFRVWIVLWGLSTGQMTINNVQVTEILVGEIGNVWIILVGQIEWLN